MREEEEEEDSAVVVDAVEAEVSAEATSAVVDAVAAEASAFGQDASAAGFHAFPAEARASRAGLLCREQDRTFFRDKTGASIALLRASSAIVARCLQQRARHGHFRNAD
jgi:hypothetical protein